MAAAPVTHKPGPRDAPVVEATRRDPRKKNQAPAPVGVSKPVALVQQQQQQSQGADTDPEGTRR